MTFPQSWAFCAYPVVLYQAINQINGKRYIGITKTGLRLRASRHFRTARLFQSGAAIGAAIRKYKQRNIKFSVLAVCPTWEYARNLEVAAIAAFKPEYNLTKGGDGAVGYRHTEEHKQRVSARQRGNKHWLGKTHTPETIEKMRISAKKARAEGRGGFKVGQSQPWHKKSQSIWSGAQNNSPHLEE